MGSRAFAAMSQTVFSSMVWPQFAFVHSSCAKFLFAWRHFQTGEFLLQPHPLTLLWFILLLTRWKKNNRSFVYVPVQSKCQDGYRGECIKWLIYDDILFYFFYASLQYVVCVDRMQSIKGSKCLVLVRDTQFKCKLISPLNCTIQLQSRFSFSVCLLNGQCHLFFI